MRTSPPTLLRTAKGGESRDTLPPMLIAESRIFEVVTFRTLHPYHSELDQRRLLLDVMVIADEADAQLMGAVRSLTAKGDAHSQ